MNEINEVTSKELLTNINLKYVNIQLALKIDSINRTMLELCYKLLAVNATFVSVPIKISLEGDISNLINKFKLSVRYIKKEILCDYPYFDIADPAFINGQYIRIEVPDSLLDDMGRECIIFTYFLNDIGISDDLNIPIDIYYKFVDSLIKVLTDKDIIEEEKEEEVDIKEDDIDEENETSEDNTKS